MAKHIAVFGSPGSGKSVFSAALARAVSKRRKRCILISSDSIIPMLSFFCGDSRMSGLGELCAGEITPQRTAEAVKVLREYHEIGVMGYRLEDEFIPVTQEQVRKLYAVVDGMVDVVIWDGNSDLNGAFERVALAYADLKVCVLTADPKGLLYFEQNRFTFHRLRNRLLMEGLGRPYSPREELGIRTGGLDGMLPYSREVERCIIEGNAFSIDRYCHEQYRQAVEQTIDRLLEG